MANNSYDTARWSQFLRMFAGVSTGLVVTLLAFVIAMNPYGNLPTRLLGDHVIMDINQRYQYPAIVRSGRFDSFVLGTSSARLLNPPELADAFPGRWANLAMNDARAWEEYQLALLLLRQRISPRNLLIGLDTVWCRENADVERTTRRGFPEWMYDDTVWNDWVYLLNSKALEIAGRIAGYRLGLVPARLPGNGYDVFVPPEAEYDLARARQHIWQGPPRTIVPVEPPVVPPPGEVAGWAFPATQWLEEILSLMPEQSGKFLVYMPAHAAGLPQPGSLADAREGACKARIAEIASRHGAVVVDFRRVSPLTTRDENFWDSLHYRVPIATRIVRGIADAVGGEKFAADGSWVRTVPATP